MRGAVTTLIVLTVPVMVALPALGHAQSPTITRGVSGDPCPRTRAPVCFGGAAPGRDHGRRARNPAARWNGWAAPGPSARGDGWRVPGHGRGRKGPGDARGTPPTLTPVLIGPLPADASVGALTAPVSPGTRLGEPGPDEIMKGLDSQARIYLQDGNYAQGEQMLNGSVAIREDMVGRVSPGVAGALETDAQLMRHYSRDAAAADMEVRAKEIRTKLEPPPAPKKPDRF